MVLIRHIVSWNFKEEFTAEENRNHALKMKNDLEALKEKIPGIISLEVVLDLLPGSNHDIALYSSFESEQALAVYQRHPEHVRVSNWIGTVVKNRACIDFVEK